MESIEQIKGFSGTTATAEKTRKEVVDMSNWREA